MIWINIKHLRYTHNNWIIRFTLSILYEYYIISGSSPNATPASVIFIRSINTSEYLREILLRTKFLKHLCRTGVFTRMLCFPFLSFNYEHVSRFTRQISSHWKKKTTKLKNHQAHMDWNALFCERVLKKYRAHFMI